MCTVNTNVQALLADIYHVITVYRLHYSTCSKPKYRERRGERSGTGECVPVGGIIIIGANGVMPKKPLGAIFSCFCKTNPFQVWQHTEYEIMICVYVKQLMHESNHMHHMCSSLGRSIGCHCS